MSVPQWAAFLAAVCVFTGVVVVMILLEIPSPRHSEIGWFEAGVYAAVIIAVGTLVKKWVRENIDVDGSMKRRDRT